MNEFELMKAHKHSISNRIELESSNLCGCFYCLAIYPPSSINDESWDSTENVKSEQTLFCPKCGIDSVIGSASGYVIDEHFLVTMKDYWF